MHLEHGETVASAPNAGHFGHYLLSVFCAGRLGFTRAG